MFFVAVLFSFITAASVYANHVIQPSPPKGKALGTAEVPSVRQFKCGILIMLGYDSGWVFYELMAKLIRIDYFDNKAASLDIWLDNDSDGHFDEYFHFRSEEELSKFINKYPTPCSLFQATK